MEQLATEPSIGTSSLSAPYSRVLSTMNEEIERLSFERDALSAAIESLEKAARSLGSTGPISPPPQPSATSLATEMPSPPAAAPPPQRSHHKSDSLKPRSGPNGSAAPSGTIRSRVRGLLAADPSQSWSAVELVAALKSEGLANAVDPDAAMRTLLARLLGNGQIERRDRGRYGAVSSR